MIRLCENWSAVDRPKNKIQGSGQLMISSMSSEIIFLMFLLIFFHPSIGLSLEPKEIQFENETYELLFKKTSLTAKSRGRTIEGVLEKRLGKFSQWNFTVDAERSLELHLILNEALNKVIYHGRLNMGPYLWASSQDSKYVVFDYGSDTGPRGFEIRDAVDGKLLLKEIYLWKLKWNRNAFEYDRPEMVDSELNESTKKCTGGFNLYRVTSFKFDGKKNIQLKRSPKFSCSH